MMGQFKVMNFSSVMSIPLAAWVGGWALFLVGCGANVPPPTQAYADFAQAQGHPLTLDSLIAGHTHYVQQCGGCHGLRRPAKFAPEKWPHLVREMQSKSDTALPHLESIQVYLMTASGYLRDSTAQAKASPKAPSP